MNKIYKLENGLEVKVIEVKSQREILGVLDAKIKKIEDDTYLHVFGGESYMILYKDGSKFIIDELGEIGIYRKNDIVAIKHTTLFEVEVYGDYVVDKKGYVDSLTPYTKYIYV